MTSPAPLVSVIIKTLNESANIARAIESALAATRDIDAEIIVADSQSDDDTVRIAARYPVTIVRLEHARDRGCGVGAQLGWQAARGTYLYAMDGDMALAPGFLEEAIAALMHDPGLAGVGGRIEEMHPSMLEQRNRQLIGGDKLVAGPVDRLYGGGLYRRAALLEAGYFTHRHLHGYEELELALRLRARGWRMMRLASTAVYHYGHRLDPFRLLALRWRSRYAFAPGEFLRVAVGQPYFTQAVCEVGALLTVLVWWILLAAGVAVTIAAGSPPALLLALAVLAIAPPLGMIARKRSLELGLYAVACWGVFVPGLVAGFLRRPSDPAQPVAATVTTGQADTAGRSRAERVTP